MAIIMLIKINVMIFPCLKNANITPQPTSAAKNNPANAPIQVFPGLIRGVIRAEPNFLPIIYAPISFAHTTEKSQITAGRHISDQSRNSIKETHAITTYI